MIITRAIYVQGCARSGNTLIRELCVAAFKGAELVRLTEHRAECSLTHVVDRMTQSIADTRILVASRNYENSFVVNRNLLHTHPEIKILWTLRDPRDVLTSLHPERPGEFYVTPERWIASFELYRQFKDEPQVLTIRYEDLVTRPCATQKRITKSFNLTAIRKFGDAHNFFPCFYENARAMHSIRPIDTNSIHKWRKCSQLTQYLKQIYANHPAIIRMAGDCGYDITL